MAKKHHPGKNVAKPKAKPQAKPKPTSTSASTVALPPQDVKHQQTLLTLFSSTFDEILKSDDIAATIQNIKAALYDRDFAKAFGTETYLEAYAARWSPTRALGYANVLEGLHATWLEPLLTDQIGDVSQEEGDRSEGMDRKISEEAETDSIPKTLKSKMNVLSIGGCAAEHVAFASYLSQHSLSCSLTLLDSAPWGSITDRLQNAIVTQPVLPKYTSASIVAAAEPLLLPEQLDVKFLQKDALSLPEDEFKGILGQQPLLVTIFFTLNELYTSAGIGKTTKFVAHLGQLLPSGSILLVLDSPGSYSEASVGKEKKKYPMQWLLDHTLLETKLEGCKWSKLHCEESIWFRLPSEGLDYPLQLENMRYQMHMYQVEKV
ncbi:uncharacterized protein F5Z01DRAFT_248416 [Emericellopsis atlantica]|uniref:25S rRNA (Uridine(2843)-N(3))-methyltransferase n=1 Tax=Emericellopsis atlantica TaxID=2614577 RepID=A0A9P8CM46_9HYPO|nr:uncharacterized protein F5Z01DRAFT_248416 [Emericellopsis atlantica]KAG9252073.1 hypothetical protein F5Z01DRAFT_248416 [Emericellopsis atlantica]